MLTGITSAANVLPLTTLRSYMMFWGAILLYSQTFYDRSLHVFAVGVSLL